MTRTTKNKKIETRKCNPEGALRVCKENRSDILELAGISFRSAVVALVGPERHSGTQNWAELPLKCEVRTRARVLAPLAPFKVDDI